MRRHVCWIGLIGLTSCDVVFDIERKQLSSTTVDGSTTDGAVDSASDASPPLSNAGVRPPPPPSEDVDPGVGRSRAFLARTYYLGAIDPETGQKDPLAWQRIGFDVDGVQTTEAEATSDAPGTCLRTAGSRPDALVDGDDGRDNAFGSQFLKTAAEFGDSLESVEVGASKGPERGDASLVVILRGLGNGPNDPEVEVGLATSVKHATVPDWSETEQERDIDGRSVVPGTVIPKLKFDNAYMTNHVVVAGALHEPPPAPLILPFDPEARPITMSPHGFVLTLGLNETHWRVERSTLHAVVSISDMISFVTPAAVRAGIAACTPGGQQLLASLVRPLADLSADKPQFLDPTSSDLCNAISVAMQIDWVPLVQPNISHVREIEPATDICAE